MKKLKKNQKSENWKNWKSKSKSENCKNEKFRELEKKFLKKVKVWKMENSEIEKYGDGGKNQKIKFWKL